MSRRTREINRITTAIITISIKLMVLALLILLLYEAVVRGGRDSKRGRGRTKEKGTDHE